ncbi:MAG: hypothetical protein JNL82_37240 [Myxococcales bacterium]|nr:hypothetical protein [Myxococcales bacterium]
MSGAQRSQTDLEVLQSSHRGKFISLGLVLVVGAGVWWWSHRDKPIGQREQADRVLVVTQTAWRYKPYLESWGFTAQEGRAQTMEDEAREKMPDLTVSGPAAILKLADWAGYGYVVFENPRSIDFSGLDIAGGLPTFEPWHRFAVVSAGDYAFPHKLTVNAKPSEVLRGPDLDLLSALFQQEPLLAGTLRDDPKNPAEVLILKTTLSEALARHDDVKAAESLVARIGEKARALLVDKEQGEPKPALLGGIHESLNAIALADGSTLVLSRKIHFSSGGYNADLDLDKNWEFSYLPAGAEPGSERVPCPSLLGGTLEETGRRPNFRFAPGGDVVLVHVDGASQLWKLDAAAKEPCTFVHLGDVTIPLVRGEDPGEPHASGKVARVRNDGPDGVLAVVKPREEVPLELARSPRVRFHMPAWLDADWLAAPGYPAFDEDGDAAPAPAGVFIASPSHPDVLLRLDATALDASMDVHQVAPAPDGPNGPRLLVTASSEARGQRLFRVDAPRPWAELFTAAEAAAGKKPQAVVDGTEPWVLSLDAAGLTATALTSEGWVSDPVAARDGSSVVFQVSNIDNGIADADSRKEIGITGLNTPGPLKLMTRNGLEDHTPMFSADSKTVVFRTRFPFEKTDWTLTTARSLPAK